MTKEQLKEIKQEIKQLKTVRKQINSMLLDRQYEFFRKTGKYISLGKNLI